MDLGKRIERWRKFKGMSQQDAADIIGITPEAICQWETGHTTPTVSNLDKMIRAMGLTQVKFWSSMPKKVA